MLWTVVENAEDILQLLTFSEVGHVIKTEFTAQTLSFRNLNDNFVR